MKKIFIAAHKMTREIVKEYEVNYQVQFGLNLSYLLEKEEEKEMTNLQGTEKQVKYATDLINHVRGYVDTVVKGYEEGKASDDEKETFNEIVEESIRPILENEKSWEVISKLKEKVEDLWQLEDESFMNDFDRFEGIERPYNLADEIAQILEETFA